MSAATTRLVQERKAWRKDHPTGFWARPTKSSDGSTNIMSWEAGIPGKEGTIWEKGLYPVKITYHDDFPATPPVVAFSTPLFHPNIYPSGRVCLSILDEMKDWKPSITLKQILLGVQDLLEHPNPKDPAQQKANMLFLNDKAAYEKIVLKQALKFSHLKNA